MKVAAYQTTSSSAKISSSTSKSKSSSSKASTKENDFREMPEAEMVPKAKSNNTTSSKQPISDLLKKHAEDIFDEIRNSASSTSNSSSKTEVGISSSVASKAQTTSTSSSVTKSSSQTSAVPNTAKSTSSVSSKSNSTAAQTNEATKSNTKSSNNSTTKASSSKNKESATKMSTYEPTIAKKTSTVKNTELSDTLLEAKRIVNGKNSISSLKDSVVYSKNSNIINIEKLLKSNERSTSNSKNKTVIGAANSVLKNAKTVASNLIKDMVLGVNKFNPSELEKLNAAKATDKKHVEYISKPINEGYDSSSYVHQYANAYLKAATKYYKVTSKALYAYANMVNIDMDVLKQSGIKKNSDEYKILKANIYFGAYTGADLMRDNNNFFNEHTQDGILAFAISGSSKGMKVIKDYAEDDVLFTKEDLANIKTLRKAARAESTKNENHYVSAVNVSNQKMYELGTHFRKHGKPEMGYQSKKEYDKAAKDFAKKYQTDPRARVIDGKWNGGGKFKGHDQRAITYDGKTVIMDRKTGQIVDFYKGTGVVLIHQKEVKPI